jgi:hypothetical protein
MMRQQPPALRALLLQQLGRASDHQGQGLARQLSYSTSKEEYLQMKDARNELAAQGARELGLEGIDLQALRGACRVLSFALRFFLRRGCGRKMHESVV